MRSAAHIGVKKSPRALRRHVTVWLSGATAISYSGSIRPSGSSLALRKVKEGSHTPSQHKLCCQIQEHQAAHTVRMWGGERRNCAVMARVIMHWQASWPELRHNTLTVWKSCWDPQNAPTAHQAHCRKSASNHRRRCILCGVRQVWNLRVRVCTGRPTSRRKSDLHQQQRCIMLPHTDTQLQCMSTIIWVQRSADSMMTPCTRHNGPGSFCAMEYSFMASLARGSRQEKK